MRVNYEIIPDRRFLKDDLLDIFVKIYEIEIKHSSKPYDCIDEVTIKYDICLEYFSDDEERDYIIMPDGRDKKKAFELYSNRDFYQCILDEAIQKYYSERH